MLSEKGFISHPLLPSSSSPTLKEPEARRRKLGARRMEQ